MRTFICLFILLFFLLFSGPVYAQQQQSEGDFIRSLEAENKRLQEMNQQLAETATEAMATVRFSKQEQKAMALAKKWDKEATAPSLSGGKVLYVYGAAIPTIICSPMMLSDLELQTGETVSSIVLGDSARWQVEIVEVGSEAITPHVVFKPVDSGLETSAVIATDRRAYHVRLKSQRKQSTPYSGFVYPGEIRTHLASARRKVARKVTQVAVQKKFEALHFGFDLEPSKSRLNWLPVQVYSDKVKTYIRMPKSIAQGEMPVLLVENVSGDQALVNYRILENTFIVDQLFDKATLIMGAGRRQEQVIITRTEERG